MPLPPPRTTPHRHRLPSRRAAGRHGQWHRGGATRDRCRGRAQRGVRRPLTEEAHVSTGPLNADRSAPVRRPAARPGGRPGPTPGCRADATAPAERPWWSAPTPTTRPAQRAVDYLSDNQFPVERTAIVGTDLRLVENVLGRLTTGRAALAGAASGAWFGLLFGLLIGIFSDSGWIGRAAACGGHRCGVGRRLRRHRARRDRRSARLHVAQFAAGRPVRGDRRCRGRRAGPGCC